MRQERRKKIFDRIKGCLGVTALHKTTINRFMLFEKNGIPFALKVRVTSEFPKLLYLKTCNLACLKGRVKSTVLKKVEDWHDRISKIEFFFFEYELEELITNLDLLSPEVLEALLGRETPLLVMSYYVKTYLYEKKYGLPPIGCVFYKHQKDPDPHNFLDLKL